MQTLLSLNLSTLNNVSECKAEGTLLIPLKISIFYNSLFFYVNKHLHIKHKSNCRLAP